MADNLIRFFRLNEGKLGRKRREGEFEKLTDYEEASIEAVVQDAFEGLRKLAQLPQLMNRTYNLECFWCEVERAESKPFVFVFCTSVSRTKMICSLPLQVCLCKPSQEGAPGGMCFAKLLHRQLEPRFIPMANSQVMQIH